MKRVLDQICEQLEQSWRQGDPLPIESLLEHDRAGTNDAGIQKLLHLEISLRHAAGEVPTIDDYLGRFPQFESFIRDAISNVTDAAHEIDNEYQRDSSVNAATQASARTIHVGVGEFNSEPSDSEREKIGRYVVLCMLGQGGQASVYRGVHPTLPLEVAIKLGHSRWSHSDREALREEANILCDLEHPHIARVRDFGFDDGRPFLVLDFVRGRSLHDVLKSQTMSPARAAELIAQAADAVHYAHNRGVLHRDLKPHNVIIDDHGTPKIIDFGLSRLRSGLVGSEQEPDGISGTLAYMPPEQAVEHQATTDHRVDIFSLGAILYQLLVGHPPYVNLMDPNLVERVRRCEFDRQSLAAADIPDSLKAICRRAMESDPNDRFETAEAFSDALREAIADMAKQPQGTKGNRSRVFALGIVTVALIFPIAYCSGLPLYRGNSLAKTAPSGSLIETFEAIHFGNSPDEAEFRGSLLQYGSPLEQDDLQFKASFTEPAYCFLVALNPDGAIQLCYPEDEQVAQSKAIRDLRYPEDEDHGFRLTDGAGMQAFVLYASREPLPAFAHWHAGLKDPPWPITDTDGGWTYQAGELQPIDVPSLNASSRKTRGDIRKLKVPTEFMEICDGLRGNPPADVRGVLFPVKPRSDN